MADDARLAELRAVLAEVLPEAFGWARWNVARVGHVADALLPVVEAYAAQKAAEELGEALSRSASRGPLEAVAWMARRHAALTPATEEKL